MGKRWLVKTEPSEYSFSDLLRDERTRWEGVANPLARKHLAAMAPGDEVLVYHTGSEKAVVGTARVAAAAGGEVDLAAGAALPRPVALRELKADKGLAGWELVRLPRLSVLPVTEGQWGAVMAKAKQSPKT
jgi:predicted RNA-binding protein with PUA-like domain